MAPTEPIARGVIVTLPRVHADKLDALAKEALVIIRAIHAEASPAVHVEPDADFALLLLEADSAPPHLPDLKDRAGSVIAIGDDAPACRAAIARARKELRAHGATLGARELVFAPADFGYLGLESDGLREKLEILLRTLILDGERLRLRREGWEEPEAAAADLFGQGERPL